jgi:hypothetical protein
MATITVISHKGKLVGSWIPPRDAVVGGAVSTPVAGHGQELHYIEIEEPESYARRKALPELHQMIKERLRLE